MQIHEHQADASAPGESVENGPQTDQDDSRSMDLVLKSKTVVRDQLVAIGTKLINMSSPVSTSTPIVPIPTSSNFTSNVEQSQPLDATENLHGSPLIRRSTFPSRSPAIKRARSKRKSSDDEAEPDDADLYLIDTCSDPKSESRDNNNIPVVHDQPPLRNRLHERSLLRKSQILSQRAEILSPATMQSTSAVLTKVRRETQCSRERPMRRSLSADDTRSGGRDSMRAKRRFSLSKYPGDETSVEETDYLEYRDQSPIPPSMAQTLLNVTKTPGYLSPRLKRESLKSLMKKPLLNHSLSGLTRCWNHGSAERVIEVGGRLSTSQSKTPQSTQSIETPLLFSDLEHDEEIEDLLTDNEEEGLEEEDRKKDEEDVREEGDYGEEDFEGGDADLDVLSIWGNTSEDDFDGDGRKEVVKRQREENQHHGDSPTLVIKNANEPDLADDADLAIADDDHLDILDMAAPAIESSVGQKDEDELDAAKKKVSYRVNVEGIDPIIEARSDPALEVSEDFGEVEILKDFQPRSRTNAGIANASAHEVRPTGSRVEMKRDQNRLEDAISRFLLSSQFRDNIRDLCNLEE